MSDCFVEHYFVLDVCVYTYIYIYIFFFFFLSVAKHTEKILLGTLFVD